MLLELRDMLTEIEVTDAAFRTSRISNYVALEGRLPEDKEAMLQTVDRVLAMGEAAPLMPEVLRGM